MLRFKRHIAKALTGIFTLAMMLACMASTALAVIPPEDVTLSNQSGDLVANLPVSASIKDSILFYFPLSGNFGYDGKSTNTVTLENDSTTANTSPISFAEDSVRGAVADFRGTSNVQATNTNNNINLGAINYGSGDTTMDFSFAYWFKSSDTRSDPTVVSNKDWTSGGNPGYYVGHTNSGSFRLNFKADGQGRIDPFGAKVSDGQWHYLVVTLDRHSGTYIFYMDGERKEISSNPNTALQSIEAGFPTRIGSDGRRQYGYFGLLNEFMMFDKALSAAEVVELANYYGLEAEVPKDPLTYMLTSDKSSAQIGDTFTTTLKIENKTIFTHESAKATLLTSASNSEKIAGESIEKSITTPLAPGESAELTWQTTVTAGGLVAVHAVIFGDDGKEIRVLGDAVSVPTSTTGWYKIDGHSHTTYSDGAGTVAQNQDMARRNGVNSLTLTDHHNSNGWNDMLAYVAANPDMLPVIGNEYTSGTGHAVVINVTENTNFSTLSWRNMIAKANEMNSLLYVAHPFEGDSWRNSWDDIGYNGLEIWNNWWAPRHPYNAKARDKWDELNRAGRKLFGITDTDAHKVELIGRSWMSVYLPSGFTTENMISNMKAGHMYGSNGPHLEFSAKVNNASGIMGDSLQVPDSGQVVTFSVSGNFDGGLNKLLIIKNGTTVGTILIRKTSFKNNFELDIKPGDFVRVELEGYENDIRTFSNDYSGDVMAVDGLCAPFAFSNPIFFDEVIPVSNVSAKPLSANIVGSPTVVTYVESMDALADVLADGVTSSVMVDYTTISDAKALLRAVADKALPIFVLTSESDATVLARLIAQGYEDTHVASSDPAVLRAYRDIATKSRASLIIDRKITLDDVRDIIVTANTCRAQNVVVSTGNADKKTIEEIQRRFTTVWMISDDTTVGNHEAITSGVTGIITSNALKLKADAAIYDTKTLTRRPFIIAHRGLSSQAPENTLPSYEKAFAAGADMMECDVYITKDGEIIFLHDDYFTRTTNISSILTEEEIAATGKAVNRIMPGDLTLAQIKRFDAAAWTHNTYAPQGWAALGFAGTQIPTLREVIEFMKGKDIILVCELKDGNVAHVTPTYEVIKSVGEEMLDQVVFISFQDYEIQHMITNHPDAPTGRLTAVSANSNPVTHTKNILNTILPLNSTYNPTYTNLTQDSIAQLIARGVSLWPYTLNTTASVRQYIDYGISGVTTDYADRTSEAVMGISAASSSYTAQAGETMAVECISLNNLGVETELPAELVVIEGAENVLNIEGNTISLIAGTSATVLLKAQSPDVANCASYTLFSQPVTVTSAEANKVSFGVISDTHIGGTGHSVGTNGQRDTLNRVLDWYTELGVDALSIVGDITDSASAAQFTTLKTCLDEHLPSSIQRIFTMGNHDSNQWARYEDATGCKANDHVVINGYHFIMTSPGSGTIDPVTGRSSGTATGSYITSWVAEQIALAEADPAAEGKPIFVFFHHPIRGTFYVSDEWNSSSWGNGSNNIFLNHPRVVTFSGHIHSPNNDPRSIWQDGGFTAVNTVTTYYYEMESGYIGSNANFSGTSTYPAPNGPAIQGLIVEADGSNVTIKNYDFKADAWIEQVWTFDVSEPLPYTNARAEKAVKPVFGADAKISAAHVNNTTVAVTFDQAAIPGANEIQDVVHSYRYEVYNAGTGALFRSAKQWSDFMYTNIKPTYTQNINGLTLGETYELRLYAVSSFGQTSEGYLSVYFKAGTGEVMPTFAAETLTLTPGADASAMNFTWYSDREDNAASALQLAPKSAQTDGEFPSSALTVEGTVGDASAGKSWHKVSVSNLTPDTAYIYRVSNNKDIYSEIYEFTTGATGDFQFIAVGDPQLTTGNQDSDSVWPNPVWTTRAGWLDTMNKISQFAPQAAFMAGTGDQVDTATNETQYTNYFAPAQLRSLPVAPAVGNHEGTAPNFGWHYNVPNETAYGSQTDAYGNYWYSYNNALFVVLNTAPYPANAAAAAPYIEIMDSTLAAATSSTTDYDWLFVQHHKSTASPASHQTDADVLVWAPLFNALMDKYSVDFVLAGHDHVYSRSWAIKDGQKVNADYSANEITDPAGTIYFTFTTASGLKYYDFLQTAPAAPAWVNDISGMYTERLSGANNITGKPWYTNVGIQIKVPQFTTVDVTDNSVTFKTYRTDTMAAIDEYTVRKSGGVSEEIMAAYDKAHADFSAYYNTSNWTFLRELFAGYTEESVTQAGWIMGSAGQAHADLLAAHGKLAAGRFDAGDSEEAIVEGTRLLNKGIADMLAALVPVTAEGITVNFPGLKDVTVQYYTNISQWVTVGKFDDTCNFSIPESHKATWGVTTVRIVKDGMYHTFTLDAADQALVLDAPLSAITVTGIAADCNLAIVQNDWVYRYAPATVGGENEFLVFGNGKAYEIRLQKPGASIISIKGIAAGQTVDLSEHF